MNLISDIWRIGAVAQPLLPGGLASTPFAALSLNKLKITRCSQKTDVMTFKGGGDAQKMDSAFIVPWGTLCQVTKAGQPWFAGRLTKPQPQATSTAEGIDYELSGPWWDLDNCTYQQQGSFYNGNPSAPAGLLSLTPLIYLGYEAAADSGNFGRLTTGGQIRNILAFAIQCGANLQIGNIDVGILFPCSKQKATSCARLIIEVMQWVQDQTFSFDYSTTPPTANVVKRSNAKVVTYAFPGPPAKAINLTPRNDLQVPCVGLFYVFGSNAGGSSWNSQSSDIYPPGANLLQLRALVAPLELGAGSITTQKQPVTAPAYPNPGPGGPSTLPVIQWFMDHCGSLQGLTAAKLTMVTDSWFVEPADGQKDCNGNALTGFDDPENQLPNELVAGAISPWMAKPKGSGTTAPGDGYQHAAKLTIRCQIQYTGDDTDPNFDFSTWINNDPAGQWFFVTIMATDATTQTYQKPISETNAEQPPAGMAEYIYTALSLLHYEGEFPIKEQECSGGMQVGNVLNLTGGRAEWATMLAQIQKVSENIDDGETTASVGPPKQLGPAELLTLIRSWRNLAGVEEGFDGRATASNDACSGSDGIGQGPAFNGDTPPPTVTPGDFQLSDLGGGNLGIYSGTVKDTTTGGVSWVPAGLTLGQYTAEPVSGSDAAAWLVISYDEAQPPNITSVSYDSGPTTPDSISGTLYFEIGRFSISGGKITILTSPVGSLNFAAWFVWATSPAVYDAECA